MAKPAIHRDEVEAMLFAIADLTSMSGGFSSSSRKSSVKRRKYQKTTPEEWARQRENQERIARVLEPLVRGGLTREEALRRLRNPKS